LHRVGLNEGVLFRECVHCVRREERVKVKETERVESQ
jgi:hypothetical protein